MTISRKATHSWVMLPSVSMPKPINIDGGVRFGLHHPAFATSKFFALIYSSYTSYTFKIHISKRRA